MIIFKITSLTPVQLGLFEQEQLSIFPTAPGFKLLRLVGRGQSSLPLTGQASRRSYS